MIVCLVRTRLALAAPAVGCALALAACGGGSGSSSSSTASAGASTTTASPKPEQPLSAEIKPWNAALAAKSCRREAPFMFSTIRQQDPGTPATSSECPGNLAPQPPPEAVVFTHAAEYGTGGLMEGPAGGNPPLTGISVWALDSDGQYRYTGIYGQFSNGSPIGGKPSPDNGAAATASRFVEAARDGDCAALKKTINPGGRLAAGPGGVAGACDGVIHGQLFAPAVRETPDAKPHQLGLVEGFGFYGIATDAAYFTIITGATADSTKQRVYDVLPATAVKPAA